jgi:hypothetical protein
MGEGEKEEDKEKRNFFMDFSLEGPLTTGDLRIFVDRGALLP